MTDYTSMPPRLYKLYSQKVREMPSLRTDDITGAKPKRTNYAKHEILERYKVARSQVYVNNDPKTFVYYSPLDSKREQFIPQSEMAASYVDYAKLLGEYPKPHHHRFLSGNTQQGATQSYAKLSTQVTRSPSNDPYDITRKSTEGLPKMRSPTNPNIFQDSLDVLNSQLREKAYPAPNILSSSIEHDKPNQTPHILDSVQTQASPIMRDNGSHPIKIMDEQFEKNKDLFFNGGISRSSPMPNRNIFQDPSYYNSKTFVVKNPLTHEKLLANPQGQIIKTVKNEWQYKTNTEPSYA